MSGRDSQPTASSSKDDLTAAFRDFISRCGHAIYTNRDSGQVWVRREDLAVMREISERFFLATLPPASPELIAEARRQGKLPPAVETPAEPKPDDPVWVSPVFGCPTEGWTVARVEHLTTVYLKHPNGSLITVPPGHWGLKALAVKTSPDLTYTHCDKHGRLYQKSAGCSLCSAETTRCKCPEVCQACGGRVQACLRLGHRPEKDRNVQWHKCPAVSEP